MRVLLIDTRYPESIRAWYRRHASLSRRSFDAQAASFASSFVGETPAQAAALRELGYEAFDVVANLMPAQIAWLGEHARSRREAIDAWIRARSGKGLRRLLGSILLRQIDDLKPDVIHLAALDVLEMPLIREIRARARVLVVQIAARLPEDRWVGPYDLVVSSLPNFVERFTRLGVRAEWLPLAFDRRALAVVGSQARTVPVSFVGSIAEVHDARTQVVAAVSESTTVDVWSADAGVLSDRPGVRLHGPVWGVDMYRVLASSQQTINNHARSEQSPPGHANNYRLFEATGMGALLVTDRLGTLPALFDDGREVVTYSSPRECQEVVHHYLEHPDEARAIAAAGQARTLREHTWIDRMAREMSLVRAIA